MFKMSAFGLNTSSQVYWPLVNSTISQRLLYTLHHTAAGCVWSATSRKKIKLVLCTFLDNFLFLFVSRSYQKITESVADHCSLLIRISFKSKLCLLQYQFKIFTSYLLKFI